MRKLLLIGLAVTLFGTTNAQTEKNDWAIGLHYGTQEYSGDLGDEFLKFNHARAFGLSLSKYLTPFWDVQGMATFNTFSSTGSNLMGMPETQFLDFNIMAKLKFNNGKWLKETSMIAPYLFAGFGDGITKASHYTNNSQNISVDVNMLAGLGFNIQLTEKFAVDLKSKYTYMWNDDMDNSMNVNDYQDQALMTTVGLVYSFSKGVDTDGDGIKDKLDKCPTVAGLLKFMGCPDTDADGVEDSKDACPKVAGTINGCPDSDKDGIIDSEDACPQVAGIKAMKGCPDADGDGVTDSKDACPSVKGTVKGCPDTDGDGVADKDDKCPKVKGAISNAGCPNDKDNDGIIDSKDKCPTIAGVASNNGCPEVKEETKKVMAKAMEGLFFGSGSSVIRSKSYTVLNNVASIMNANPTYKLSISGYTDNTGNEAKNLSLSKARAAAAKAYLVKKGVSASRLTSEGYGISNPRADNSTAAGRKLNRRVEFKVGF